MYGSETSASASGIRVVSRQTAGRPSWVSTPLPFATSSKIACADHVARAERVGELFAVRVQQHGAVRARRLGDRVALHRLRPGAAVRVVLERVEVARLGAQLERDRVTSPVAFGWFVESSPRSCGLLEAAPAGGEHDRRRVELVLAARARQPVLALLERGSGLLAKSVPPPASNASRSPFVIACPVRSPTWSRRLRRGAAAAREAIAAVLSRELDAELLEPVDRAAGVAGEHLDEPHVGASRGSLADVLRRAARASRRRRRRPGCRPAPWPSCTPASSPSSRCRHWRRRARRRRRRRGPRRHCRLRARRKRVRAGHGVRIPDKLMHCISASYSFKSSTHAADDRGDGHAAPQVRHRHGGTRVLRLHARRQGAHRRPESRQGDLGVGGSAGAHQRKVRAHHRLGPARARACHHRELRRHTEVDQFPLVRLVRANETSYCLEFKKTQTYFLRGPGDVVAQGSC